MSTPIPSNTLKFLSPQQLALRWGVHPITLRRWRASGRIVATRFGRGIRFALAEIERFEHESVESFR
jgi:excisionase family DNA binding protein